jgi:hypothetical protein
MSGLTPIAGPNFPSPLVSEVPEADLFASLVPQPYLQTSGSQTASNSAGVSRCYDRRAKNYSGFVLLAVAGLVV